MFVVIFQRVGKKMLAEKKIDNGRSFSDQLVCDICGSMDIADTTGGYVCKSCGIVLEIEKLEYHRPYSESSLQYASLNNYTSIGSSLERLSSSDSSRLQRLQKQQKIIEKDKSIEQSAKIEVSRIFSANSYPDQYRDQVFSTFISLRKKIKERSKYRSVNKLVPLSIFVCFKLNSIPIIESKLLEVSNITKKDFSAFKFRIYELLPQYKNRNREQYILRKIFEVVEHFGLGMDFYYQSKKILLKLWGGVKNTTDLSIAGLVSAISILCSNQRKVTVNALCKHLGLGMSTIQSQVKSRIFDRFRVSGFVSLIKSSEVLRKIMIRLGLIEVVSSEIKLGNAVQVFNYFSDRNYYTCLFKNIAGNYSILLSKNGRSLDFNLSNINNSKFFGDSYDLSVVNFSSSGAGPPPVIDPG